MPSPRPSAALDAEELRKLFWSLRPTFRDLFRGYEVPDEEATVFLRDTIDVLIRDHDRIGHLRGFVLETLERRCRRYRESLAEEKEPDGGPSES